MVSLQFDEEERQRLARANIQHIPVGKEQGGGTGVRACVGVGREEG